MVSSTPVGSTRSSGSSTATASSCGARVASTQPIACPRPNGSACTTDSTLIRPGARRTLASIAFLPRASRVPSSTRSSTKCATTPSLPSEVTITSRSAPASAASAATSSMPGVSTTGSNSLGTVLVAGRNRVPRPAAGTMAVRGTGPWAGGRGCGGGTDDIVHTITAAPRHTRCGGAKVKAMAVSPKAALRRRLLAARSAVPAERHAAEADTLRAHLAALPVAGCTVCAYVPAGAEPGTPAMPAALRRRGLRVLVPAVAAGDPAPLHWGGHHAETLAAGRFGLAAPPRPLADPRAPRVAVVRDDELLAALPADPHDVAMTHALTPGRGLVALTGHGAGITPSD